MFAFQKRDACIQENAETNLCSCWPHVSAGFRPDLVAHKISDASSTSAFFLDGLYTLVPNTTSLNATLYSYTDIDAHPSFLALRIA